MLAWGGVGLGFMRLPSTFLCDLLWLYNYFKIEKTEKERRRERRKKLRVGTEGGTGWINYQNSCLMPLFTISLILSPAPPGIIKLTTMALYYPGTVTRNLGTSSPTLHIPLNHHRFLSILPTKYLKSNLTLQLPVISCPHHLSLKPPNCLQSCPS